MLFFNALGKIRPLWNLRFIKQVASNYKVTEGQTVKIEKLKAISKGDKVTFEEVLALDNEVVLQNLVLQPFQEKRLTVSLSQSMKSKVVVVQYKSKSNYHKKIRSQTTIFKVKSGLNKNPRVKRGYFFFFFSLRMHFRKSLCRNILILCLSKALVLKMGFL